MQRPIDLQPRKVDHIVLEVCNLHYSLCRHARSVSTPVGSVDYVDFDTGEILNGLWRSDAQTRSGPALRLHETYTQKQDAKKESDQLRDYVSGVDAMPWQRRAVLL